MKLILYISHLHLKGALTLWVSLQTFKCYGCNVARHLQVIHNFLINFFIFFPDDEEQSSAKSGDRTDCEGVVGQARSAERQFGDQKTSARRRSRVATVLHSVSRAGEF